MAAVWLATSAAAPAQEADAATPPMGSETGAQAAAMGQDQPPGESRSSQVPAPVLARRLGLPLPLAARVASLLALEDALCNMHLWEDEDAHAAAIQGVESKFIALLNLAPDNPALADEVHDFYKRCDGETAGTEVLDFIARARDPSAMALHLAGVHQDRRADHPDPRVQRPDSFVDHSDQHTRSTDFLLAALSVRPAAAGSGSTPRRPPGWNGRSRCSSKPSDASCPPTRRRRRSGRRPRRRLPRAC